MPALDVHAAPLTRTPHGLPARDRCLVIGAVNVTPDSFSDGGRFFYPDEAIARGVEMLEAGADAVDVGGESTRPGAPRVPEDEERRRVLPVIAELAAAGAVVSVDTMRARTADAALEAGARVVNDVSGGLADPAMATVVAAAGVPYVAMHWRGASADMQSRAVYADVVADVRAELRRRRDALVAAGVDPGQIILDPGLGFAKTAEHNWRLLAGLDALHDLGCPILIGASRKSFLGRLLADPDGKVRPVGEREHATTAVTALAAAAGAWAVRVHEVGPSLDAVRAAAALRDAGG
ncbi:MAG: dihydropteroate synthase [Gaiellaceae bacterium]